MDLVRGPYRTDRRLSARRPDQAPRLFGSCRRAGYFRSLSGVWEPAMRIIKTFALTAVLCGSLASMPVSRVVAATPTPAVAVGPPYDTIHVYLAPDDSDRLIAIPLTA